jgi:hypothetical protein
MRKLLLSGCTFLSYGRINWLPNTILAVLPGLILCLAACSTPNGRSANNPTSAPESVAVTGGRMPASASCLISKPGGGPLSEGIEFVSVDLNNSYFGKATEKIYGVGAFPTEYELASQAAGNPGPDKAELLSNAIAWGWEIEPKRDADGDWTLLTMYKEILYRPDGRGYRVDEREVQYGAKFSIADSDAGVVINCTLPNK